MDRKKLLRELRELLEKLAPYYCLGVWEPDTPQDLVDRKRFLETLLWPKRERR